MYSIILLKLIKFGIGFILFIPLYVGGSFFFPFIFPKIWLFQLAVEIIFFFYIILAVADRRYRPKINLIVYAVTILTIVLVITSLTGIDIFRSFWGNTERMSGVIAWLHFAAFSIILAGVLGNGRNWRNFFSTAVFVSILEFFYVLAQYFSASWVWLPGSQVGTIGNTDLLSIYAIFSAFFALYLWQPQNLEISKYRYFWAATFFLNIGTLFLASSRGAILGFVSGVFLYISILAWQKPQTRKIFAIVVLIPVISYGLLWLARSKDFVKNTPQLTRIVNASLKDDTVQQRFTEWGIAWSAFKARPIFGFGPNNYLHLHNAYLDPRVYNLRETNFDRAHNAYLDYASMSGVLGLGGYVFLIIALFWIFFKNKAWVFSSLMAAYAVSSFFVFDSPASYIALFLTIGFAMNVANQELEIKGNESARNAKPAVINHSAVNPRFILTISAFCLALTIFLIWQVSIKPATANYNFAKAFSGLDTSSSVPPNEAFNYYRKSLKHKTLGATEFRNQYTQWSQKNINKFSPESQLEVVDYGISELEREVADHPLVFSYMNLGFMYYFKASGLGDQAARAEFLQKAAQAYEEGIKLAPRRLEIYYSYLQLAFAAKDYARGLEVIKKTVEIAPDYGQNWWYQGIAYIANGSNDEAVKSLNRALTLWYGRFIDITEKGDRLEYDVDAAAKANYSFSPNEEILGVVNIYIKKEYWQELLLLYFSVAAADPNNIEIHKSLALVYQNLGITEKVQEELKIVERLSPK